MRLLGGAALPAAVTVVLLLAITLVALLAMGRDFSATPQFVATMWLAINHAPLRADGVTLGMLPLLPTILYGAAVAWQARQSAEPFAVAAQASLAAAERGVPTAATETAKRAAALVTCGLLLMPLAVTGLAITVLNAAPGEFPARADTVGSALTWTAVINVVAALVGLWFAHSRWIRMRVPQVLVAGLHIGLAFCFAIWALAGVTMIVALGMAWSDLGMLFGIADEDPWGQVSLGLLSIAYIPNLLVLTGSIAVGGQAHIGDASASVFSVAPGNLPALPLLAGWPAQTPHWSAQIVLVLGACAAIAVARLTAHWFATTRDGVVACFIGAATAVVVMLTVGLGAGGQVGLLGTAGFASLLTSGLVVAWVGLLGAATMALSLLGVERRRTAHEDRIRRRKERLASAAAAEAAGRGTGESAGGVADDEPTESAVAGEDLADSDLAAAADLELAERGEDADAKRGEDADAESGEDAGGQPAEVVELATADGADPAFFHDSPSGAAAEDRAAATAAATDPGDDSDAAPEQLLGSDPETTDELPIVGGDDVAATEDPGEAKTESARPQDKN